MITIAPAPAMPVALPDSAAPGLFGADEAEGPAFAAELALAMAGGEPAKLPPAAATRPMPADAIRMTIAFPAPDTGAALVEPTTTGLDAAAPIGAPAEAVTAATEHADAPPAAPMPEARDTASPPAAPSPVPSAVPRPAPTATPRSAKDAAAPQAEALIEAQPAPSNGVRGPARAEGHGPDAEEMTAPGSRPPPAPAADRGVPPVEARPVDARPTLASDPEALGDAAAPDGVAPSGVEARPEAERRSRSRLADEPSPRVTDQTAVADTDPQPRAAGNLAGTAPDAPPPDARDGVPADQPVPETPAGQPTPETLGLAAAATPAPRPAGDVPRPRGGVGTAAATTGAGAPTPPGDAAEPAPRPAPAETAPRAPAEARPDPAEPAPATDAPRPAAAQAAEPTTEPAEPRGNPADRTEQPPPRTEAAPRVLAPSGAAEALPQLQPVERAAPVAAAPPVPRAAPTPPAQQIAPVLITLAAGAAGMPDRLTLTLDPQELGRIEVEVSREGERRVAIAVLAERPETLHLLMRDAAILDRALAQAGVGAEGRSLAFDLGGGSDGRQQRGNGAATPGSSTSPQPEPARPRDPLSLLDIAI
jgi:hypothetical protein